MAKTIAECASKITRAPARIIEAALEEFTEHGIDGARVDQIVKRAGVSKQLFYYYFESKEEVYKLVLEDSAEYAINLILEQDYSSDRAEESIRKFFTIIFDQYTEMPFLVKSTVDQDYHGGAHISGRNKLRSLLPVLLERLSTFLRQGEATGELRAGVNAEFFFATTTLMLRGCFVSSCTAAMMHELHLEREESRIAWRDDCIEFALAGIRATPNDKGNAPITHAANVVPFALRRAG